MDLRAMRPCSLNTLVLAVLEEAHGGTTELALHLRADFDVVGEVLLRYTRAC